MCYRTDEDQRSARRDQQHPGDTPLLALTFTHLSRHATAGELRLYNAHQLMNGGSLHTQSAIKVPPIGRVYAVERNTGVGVYGCRQNTSVAVDGTSNRGHTVTKSKEGGGVRRGCALGRPKRMRERCQGRCARGVPRWHRGHECGRAWDGQFTAACASSTELNGPLLRRGMVSFAAQSALQRRFVNTKRIWGPGSWFFCRGVRSFEMCSCAEGPRPRERTFQGHLGARGPLPCYRVRLSLFKPLNSSVPCCSRTLTDPIVRNHL